MKNSLIFIPVAFLILVIFGCTTEKTKPDTKWDVKVSTQGEQKIWVWKPDGSKQCGGPAKLTPDIAAREAKAAGLMVYQFRNDSDGMMYPSVCGAGTGTTIELEIPRRELPKALSMGYKTKAAN